MKSFSAIVLLLALAATAGVSRAEDVVQHLGLASSSLAHGRHLLVDYKGSDPVGADTVGNGKGAKVSSLSLAPTMAPSTMIAAAPVAAPMMMAAAPVAAPTSAQTSKSLVFPAATAYGAAAPVSAPFGQSAPSVMGRRLLVDYRGSDPVGADTKGSSASGSMSVGSGSQYAKAVYRMAPAAAPMAAPVSASAPMSTILYSAVPTAGKYTMATAPTTAPGALAAPTLSGVAGRRLLA